MAGVKRLKPLKIAIFSWESIYIERVGGLSNATTYLAQSLAKYHEVHFFTRGGTDFTLANVHYHTWNPHGSNIVEYCANLSHGLLSRFYEFDNQGRPFDILHFNDWHLVEALHHLQHRNCVFSYHSTEYGRNGNIWGDWWEYREISGKEWHCGVIAKTCTVVSYTLKNEVLNLYQIPAEKLHVIPNGTIVEQFDVCLDTAEVKHAYGIHYLAPLILYIGRLTYQKGPDTLLRAVPMIRDHRWDVQVIMAGGGGMFDYLRDMAQGLPVQLIGFIQDSESVRLLNAADIVVIPSRNEPFGIVLLEAWSAGKPVVVSNVGGLSENVADYVTGMKVDSTPEGIAWGVNWYLDHPSEMEKIGRKAQSEVQNYSWDIIADRMMYIYESILS
jgi:glycosyltransferase involved in cell wall biosynthesis